MAIHRIIMNDGSMVPSDAVTAPFMPRNLSPTATETFTAKIPGKDCDTAKIEIFGPVNPASLVDNLFLYK